MTFLLDEPEPAGEAQRYADKAFEQSKAAGLDEIQEARP